MVKDAEHLPLVSTLPPQLRHWLMELSTDYRVMMPSYKAGNRIFEEVSPIGLTGIDLPQNRTVIPFKKALLPPSETLFSFEAGSLEENLDAVDTIIFGLHVCELSADRLLTAVMESDRSDFPFMERRRKTITIGVPCKRTEGCFCEKTGHDNVGPGDYDLFLVPEPAGKMGGDGIHMIAGTEAGARLAGGAAVDLVKEPAEISAPCGQGSAGITRWPLAALPEKIRQSMGAVMWDELADRCLGCGNCTIVCPLCYCFYTRDETGLDPSTGRRLRHWDSCQLVGFARVAGGYNFREARSERIWYRFSHKFMRMLETFDRAGCTGCGACFHFCPAAIDPRQVIESVLEVTDGR
ncbi:MAG: 4Fe-4S dicluster domain-containing protein [Thermoleophilia bacterium]|jgi:ferredoxin